MNRERSGWCWNSEYDKGEIVVGRSKKRQRKKIVVQFKLIKYLKTFEVMLKDKNSHGHWMTQVLKLLMFDVNRSIAIKKLVMFFLSHLLLVIRLTIGRLSLNTNNSSTWVNRCQFLHPIILHDKWGNQGEFKRYCIR